MLQSTGKGTACSHFLSQATGDVLIAVDGVDVAGETPDEVARRVVGPEGQPITVTLRITRRRGDRSELADINVTLVRQQVFQMSARLITPTVGLGLELGRVDGGLMDIRKLAPGGGAELSGKVREGDIIFSVDGKELASLPPNSERPTLILGAPYSRLTLGVLRGRERKPILLDLVRTVPLVGEYLLKHSAYRNALAHAILPPTPPVARASASPSSGGLQHGPISGPGSQGSGGSFRRLDIESLDNKFKLAMDPTTFIGSEGVVKAETPAYGGRSNQWGSGESRERKSSPDVGGRQQQHALHSESSFGSEMSSTNDRNFSSGGISTACSSIDGTSLISSRSSTASRDSIALCVRQIFGEEGRVDALRSVEGREATFSNEWVHQGNPRLLKNKMANAGFIFTPDAACHDKVTCVYCGLELGMWEPADDPWSEHQEGAPGCSFWRRSTTQGERISRDVLFTGYGSPAHSFQRLAGQEWPSRYTSEVYVASDNQGGGAGGWYQQANGGGSDQTFSF